MRRLQETFPNELVILGVHSAKFPSEQQSSNIRAAVARLGIRHPVVNDATFRVWNEYAVRAWPTLVLVDPTGRIVGVQSGEIRAEEFAPVIQAMIDEWAQEGSLDRKPLDLSAAQETSESLLRFPSKLLVQPEGRLWVADSGHHRILELALDADRQGAQIVRQFGSGEPGLQDGEGANARFQHPRGLSALGKTLYVADTGNHAIRAIRLESGQVETIAGTGEKGIGPSQTSDPRTTALRSPWSVLAFEEPQDSIHSLIFIAMAGSHQLWVLLNEERIGILAGSGQEALVDGSPREAGFNQPSDLSYGLGHLFVADAEASAIRALSLGEDARVMTLVGLGLFEFGDEDGNGAQVRLQHPAGIAFAEGVVYIADSYNHKIKTLDPLTGAVQTLIGNGRPGGRDGNLVEAELDEPEGVQRVGQEVWIADTNNHKLRVADLETGQVRTLLLRPAS